MALTNWAGNYTLRARLVHRPKSLEEAQAIVSRAQRIRVLGSRHSFTAIVDSDELMSLEALPATIEIDARAGTVRVGGEVRYGELAQALHRHGLALANLASLPHISVAGAIQTATHGSGEGNGNLATAVRELELITSSGEIVRAARGDLEFEGLVVGLGALGVVVSVTLEVEPAFEVRQKVYEGLAWDVLFEHFDEVMGSGYSVSAFTLWTDQVHQLWVKQRDPGPELPDALFGSRAATIDRHPIPGLDPRNCTPQLGLAGVWFDRLPHFRMGFTPSSGAEIQSEFLIPRANALPAIAAVRELSAIVHPLVQVSELRTVAADSLWLSPQYGRDTVGIHFTWQPNPERVEQALVQVESALRPFQARPHWGKLFLAPASAVAPLYPRLPEWDALRRRLDPRAAFRNAWLEHHVLGSGALGSGILS